MAFSYGERVRLSTKGVEKWGASYKTWTGTVNCNCAPYSVKWDQGNSSAHEDWELKKLKKTDMASLSEKLILALKKEPEKSFIKAGVLDTNETLTTEGRDVLLTFLLNKHKEEFKKEVVDPILAEEAKDAD